MSLFNYFKCCYSSKENKKQEITIDNSKFKTTDANSKITENYYIHLIQSQRVKAIEEPTRISIAFVIPFCRE